MWGTNCYDIFGYIYFFALRFHPMAIFKMEISMVIEEINHRGGETGQNLLEILPPSRAESPASGPHTQNKREPGQVSFLAYPAFSGVLLFTVPLARLWALLYLSCLSGSLPPHSWSRALHFPVISSFTLYLLSPHSLDLWHP